MSNAKQKRYAIKFVLDLAESVGCDDLHHKTKHQHRSDEFCPAEYHRDRQIYLVKQMIDEVLNKQ